MKNSGRTKYWYIINKNSEQILRKERKEEKKEAKGRNSANRQWFLPMASVQGGVTSREEKVAESIIGVYGKAFRSNTHAHTYTRIHRGKQKLAGKEVDPARLRRSEKDGASLFHGGTPLWYFRIAGRRLFVRFEGEGEGERERRERDGGDGALVKPKLGND